MELNRTKNWLYILLAFAVSFITILGGWWLYLVFKLASAVEMGQKTSLPTNLALMVKWEGLSFLALTLALGAALLWVFWQDHQKTKSLQTFYASLTHELKTPLASMRLQTQVLTDLIQGLGLEKEKQNKIERYGQRLEEDVSRLESEIDKHLQLSRTQSKGNLSLSPINLAPLIKNEAKKFPSIHLDLKISGHDKEPTVMADSTALGIIFKNLFENTQRHIKDSEQAVTITLEEKEGHIECHYADNGPPFTGDIKKLGKLFYKHDSPKGSGIGLFLSKKLAAAQGGKLSITTTPHLEFILLMKKEKAV